MPVLEPIESWAEEAEAEIEGKKHLPPSTEVVSNGLKIVTSYRFNDDDKLEKVVRTYKIERRVVSKNVALRKMWKKFGDSASDKPGPNPSNTFAGEEVSFIFIFLVLIRLEFCVFFVCISSCSLYCIQNAFKIFRLLIF